MRLLASLLQPRATAYAHCDLPCGVYDPAQARIEAESVKGICEKYQQNTDPEFRARAIGVMRDDQACRRTGARTPGARFPRSAARSRRRGIRARGRW